ncbi:hypothetical protein [Thermococcus camini]|uniref:Uncharacterized protein n=1 Tax=Thermococcus camini TaxID=2016373 RepID=A0A7G2D830_9EURY|nr:hypothetical protein [Thermococcus camini]CAD5244627.1 protein of unknown function [Thermococcus camini]
MISIKKLLAVGIFSFLIVLSLYFGSPKEDKGITGEHSFIYTMEVLCDKYFPNATCDGIAGCVEYKNDTSIAFLRVNYTLVRVWNGYEPRNGSIYRVIFRRETLNILSIEPSNWDEIIETLSMCSPGDKNGEETKSEKPK